MANIQIIPTRMELTRTKKKLFTAKKGHKLLKDKRDELMRQFLNLIHENKNLRKKVENKIRACHNNFILARASMRQEELFSSLMTPKQEIFLEIGFRNVMSVEIPVLSYKMKTPSENDIYPYGLAFTSSDLDNAVNSLSEILEDMIKLAECEKSCQLLASEIEKTRRRVNALEHVMIPRMENSIKYISMKLDENERSSQIRLMKVKDMMIKRSIKI